MFGDKMVKSFVSNKVVIKKSPIHGNGMFAIEDISKGEVVFIKGGHILGKDQIVSSAVINSYLPIGDGFFLAAKSAAEEPYVKLYINHSCTPNCGLRGEITFIAITEINKGEELTCDYAFIDDEEYAFACNCDTVNCRGVITGKDWKLASVQDKYFDFFSTYLQRKIKSIND
jgi:SET domain-containing protein